MTYRKYEMTPAQWATIRKQIEVETTAPDGTKATSWNSDIIAVDEIGHLVATPAVVKDGKIIKEAVLSPLYSVDILWQSEPLKAFAAYVVWPKNPKRFISGFEEQYKRDRDELRK